ncbi:hypothetical protein FRB94_010713 [Tulasnella sp. JGI-2019a]|nr:hypothetical protein FRB93_006219 [Tulasnella sp. JGI-2019a]KAG8993535.1 hypothetical protein FRB94_010713 [Tulasnella sp. JGI-2019a]
MRKTCELGVVVFPENWTEKHRWRGGEEEKPSTETRKLKRSRGQVFKMTYDVTGVMMAEQDRKNVKKRKA